MNLKEYFQSKSKDELEHLAERAGTTYQNLQQVFLYNGSIGKKLAARLSAESNNELSVVDLLFNGEKAA